MSELTKQRIDKWLFFARILKSRTLAASLVESGKVRVNHEKIDKPAFMIKVGDQLTITLHKKIFVCKIVDLGYRRGPAIEARELYEDISPKIETSSVQLNASIIKGARPNKKERREALVIRGRL